MPVTILQPWPWEFFSYSEMACRHCGRALMQAAFMDRLDFARRALGGPIVVVSGWRCPDHNKAVGGAEASLHMQGRAADLFYGETVRLGDLFEACRSAGLTGFGIYRSWLHVDNGPRRMWWG